MTHGGTLIIINHVHAFDPFVVLPWFGRDVTPMAKVTVFSGSALIGLGRPLASVTAAWSTVAVVACAKLAAG